MEKEFFYFTEGPFNQGYPCTFKILGTTFNSAEQYMMASKAQLFGDIETYELIMKETDYAKLKALGRQIKGFHKSIWESQCDRIVYEGNKAKFTQNLLLYIELLKTHGEDMVYLAEDNIWGSGITLTELLNEVPQTGQNKLGNILTKLREHLISQIGY